MTDVKITGPDGGEVAVSGPTCLRILEDGSTTEHRLGVAEIIIAPTPTARRSTATPSTTKVSTSSPASRASPWERTQPRRGRRHVCDGSARGAPHLRQPQ